MFKLTNLILITVGFMTTSCLNSSSTSNFSRNSIEAKSYISWKVVESKIGYDGKFSVIHFFNERTGWIGGERGLYKTENAGNNWKKVNLDILDRSRITHIFFSDIKHGWIVIQSIVTSKQDYQELQIMSTQDGGVTWELQFSAKDTLVTDMKFSSRNDGWMIGVQKFREAFVLRYNKNFEELKVNFCEIPPKGWNTCNDVVSITNIENNKLGVITHERKLFQSADGGNTWELKNTFENVDAQAGISASGTNDKQQIWILEGANSLTEGTRGKLTVNGKKEFLLSTYFAEGVYLQDGFFIVSGIEVREFYNKSIGKYQRQEEKVILATNDNGKNWKKIYRNSGIEPIVSLSMVNKEGYEVWGISTDGTVIHLLEAKD